MIKREIAFLGKMSKNKLYENEILDLLKFWNFCNYFWSYIYNILMFGRNISEE